ncbi:IS3 family transposase, partial [Candidatus Cyanaurora vandensis]|uniref:IS3 family transposase n=1 Tax=Candidatus Cyanaurora vandensis TaxID=2714958 RepID=UPI0037C199FE
MAGLCRTLKLNRAAYSRWRARTAQPERDTELHNQLQQVALAWPSYGYRHVTHELKRRGNHKRVLRLRRGDNLLCLRKPGFVNTTDANLVPKLEVTGVDPWWISDITYSRLGMELVGEYRLGASRPPGRAIGLACLHRGAPGAGHPHDSLAWRSHVV